MSRLTLSQARERIAALSDSGALVDAACIDWTQPGREAVTLAGLVQSTDDFGERENIVAVCLALLAYQSHLDHEAGQAFELAAVRRAAQSGVGADDAMDGDAFLRFDEALANGYHHAEPKE